MKEVPIQIRSAKLPIWAAWYFFLQFLYKSATFPGSTFEFYLSTQCSPLPSTDQRRKEIDEKKDPYKYAKLLIWEAWHFLIIFTVFI